LVANVEGRQGLQGVRGNSALTYARKAQASDSKAFVATVLKIPCRVIGETLSVEEYLALCNDKGEESRTTLWQVVELATHRAVYRLGSYLGKGGESAFLKDNLAGYDDYHPIVSAEPSNDELTAFHKGLNQNVYRAVMLSGTALDNYRSFAQGETKNAFSAELRKGFKVMVKRYSVDGDIPAARAAGLAAYSAALVAKESKSTEDAGETKADLLEKVRLTADNVKNIMSAPIAETIKALLSRYNVAITTGDVEGFVRYCDTVTVTLK
jgi:hypothetical protein